MTTASLLRKILPLTIAATSVAGLATVAPAHASSSRFDRAVEIMKSSMSDFQATKRSAPRPFDWRDDNCSVPRGARVLIDNDYLRIFRKACERHDFGYRNFGKGLELDRTADRRKWIDQRFKADMLRICEQRERKDGWDICEASAEKFYGAVRLFGADEFFG